MDEIMYTVKWAANGIKTHGSNDAISTLCGLKLGPKYEIINNTYDGEITCKACLNVIKIINNNGAGQK